MSGVNISDQEYCHSAAVDQPWRSDKVAMLPRMNMGAEGAS